MKHSQEELLRKLNKIYEEPELLAIVDSADSPSEAEKVAETNEYPLSLVCEVRYAAILKRDYLEAFESFLNKNGISRKRVGLSNTANSARLTTKRFACNWGNSEHENVFSKSGTMLVTPHMFLPPLFWDYELYDEEGHLVFSSKVAINRYHQPENIRCMFTEGSYSIPIGLLLICKEYGDTFQFRRVLDDDTTFCWSRSRPIGGRLSAFQGEFFSADIETQHIRESDRQVVLRTIGEKEKNLLEFYDAQYSPKVTNYHLILEEKTWYPHTEAKSLLCKIEMRYKLPHEWTRKKNQIASLVTFHSPFENSPYSGPDCKVWVSVFPVECASRNVEAKKEIAEYVDEMLKGVPEQIDFLPTLKNFFPFKREKLFFLYNEGEYDFESPLVVPEKK